MLIQHLVLTPVCACAALVRMKHLAAFKASSSNYASIIGSLDGMGVGLVGFSERAQDAL